MAARLADEHSAWLYQDPGPRGTHSLEMFKPHSVSFLVLKE